MIYTFYSYKGGVGRSMALANVAHLLYSQNKKVLMVDWDLEAPGLERFFKELYMKARPVEDNPGVIDLLLEYKQLMAHRLDLNPDDELPFTKPGDYAVQVYANDNLRLLTAGKRHGDHLTGYANAVLTFDWKDFYDNWHGAEYLQWLRERMEDSAEVVLIDSRTGLTEMGGVCTFQLADVVVMLCAPNKQNLAGTLDMAKRFKDPELTRLRGRPLEVLIVPARVDGGDLDLYERYRRDFVSEFGNLELISTKWLGITDQEWRENKLDPKVSADWAARWAKDMLNLEIPYISHFSFEEALAVREGGSFSTKMTLSFENLLKAMARLAPDNRPFENIIYQPETGVPVEIVQNPAIDLVTGKQSRAELPVIRSASIQTYHVFVASPGDVEAERQAVRRVIAELNRSLNDLKRGVQFEMLTWDDMHPDLGNPRMVILDRALLKKCDIFISILWKRFGRPPGGLRPADGQPYLSGTQREIDEAIAARRASRNSRPVIMIYRKVDPPPIDMSDEEFRQLTLVRTYLRQFEPDGENPALISKFTADQFETALRKDLLQVLGEFQQVEAASTTPAIADRAQVIAQTPDSGRWASADDELPPETVEPDDDDVTVWLRQVGLGGQPFEQNRAEQEQALPRYFVPPPGARLQSLVDAVRPVVIFGSAGCGKTALRTMVQTRCYPQRPESETLGIVFGRKELNSLITGENDQLVLPAPVDCGAAFARAVLAQLEVHAPAVLETHAHAFDWAQNGQPRGSLAAWLETLGDVIRQAGFKQALFLIDQLDEVRVIQAQPELMADVLEPLMVPELREARGLAFNYFLPDSIASQLQSRNQIFRLDRCEVLHLRWTEDLLLRLIRQRLVYHSIKQSTPYNSIGELCDITDGLAETIDAELIGLAAGNPRAVLWLAHKLIQLHGQNDDPPPLIRPKTWNYVKTAWWLEGRPLFFPQSMFWLRQDRVYFHTREIVLSGLSLALLTCLIRAEGRVCDRLELARAGWPDARPEGVSQHAIDEAMRRLKLDLTKQGVDARWVSTVRGRGFRLARPVQASLAAVDEEDEQNDER